MTISCVYLPYQRKDNQPVQMTYNYYLGASTPFTPVGIIETGFPGGLPDDAAVELAAGEFCSVQSERLEPMTRP